MGTDLVRGQNQTTETPPAFQFQPFEAEIQCPACKHTIYLWVQPSHLNGRTLCPSCTRPLSALIHKKLTEHLASGA